MSKLRCTIQAELIALMIIVISASAQAPTERSFIVKSIDSPAAPGSAEPNLYATADGRILLSLVEPSGEKRNALRFAVRTGNKWSEPRTIAEGTNWLVNWADFPSLVALADGSLVAHWLVKGGEGTHGFDINIARSTDGGKMWSKPVVPHRDGTQSEHGFVSMLPWAGKGAGIVWLDGRKVTQREHGHADHSSSEHSHAEHSSSMNEMSLRFTTLGSESRETRVRWPCARTATS